MSITRELKVLERRRDVSAMYLKGYQQVEIAAKHNVSQSQISLDLKWIRGEWLKSATASMGEIKARELAKIDKLELEYYDAWERSKKDAETKIIEGKGDKTSDSPSDIKQTIRTEGQIGDPRYLSGVQWCIEQRMKIFGMYAPTKIAPTDPTGEKEWTGQSESDLINEFNSIINTARARETLENQPTPEENSQG
jgi:hypothetical protein